MSQFVIVKSRYYPCPECHVAHREMDDYMLFASHRKHSIVKVEVEDVKAVV